ncbi:MAG: hypothetical protein K9M45_03665 [Kiritimatiellales bacterium]|nr:hypothetical protein [Kiritimatiellales bacterium]
MCIFNRNKWLAILIVATTAGYVSVATAQGVRLSVKSDGKKDSEVSNKGNTRKKTETETCVLNISLANPTPHSPTYSLEWYFFSRKVASKEKSDPAVYDRGSKQFTIPGQKMVSHSVEAKPVVKVESTVTSNRSRGRGGKGGGGNSKKTTSGSEYYAYVVLVRCNGKVIAQQSNSKTLLKPENIANLNPSMGVANSTPDKGSTKGKKKKKKK